MTASNARPIRFDPTPGWVALSILLAMAFLVGWAVDDAAWVIAQGDLTDFLPWTATGGVLVAFLGAASGLGRWRTHLVGAVVAALLVPLMVGSILTHGAGGYVAEYTVAAGASVDAFFDLIVHLRGSTAQYGHSLVILGLFLWANGQFAGYAVFGHRRALPAVVALGAVMFVNVSLTRASQLGYLALFMTLTLLLLVRLHAVDARADWLRRRIGDPGPLAALTLRSGTIFVVVAILSSLALTRVASSKPLEAVWTGTGVQDTLTDVGLWLQRYLPFVTSPKGGSGVNFGTAFQVGTSWTPGDGVAMVVARPAGDPTAYYWQAATYDTFTFDRWSQSEGGQGEVAAGAPLLDGTMELVAPDRYRTVQVRIEPDAYTRPELLSPGTPSVVDRGSTVELDAGGAFVSAVTADGAKEGYTITGVVPRGTDPTTGKDDPKGITAAMLRAAGQQYEPEMSHDTYLRYTHVDAQDRGTPEATKFLELVLSTVAANGRPSNAYDIAATMVAYLHDPNRFHYTTDVSGVDCSNQGIVECFAAHRQGFCQWYATEMAVLLRTQGIPTRVVQGFLPGTRSGPGGGTETVGFDRSHAWVEVWFPGIGWYPFDPTGGGVSALTPPAAGADVPIPSPTPVPSHGDNGDDVLRTVLGSIPPGGGVIVGPGAGSGPFIVIAIVLAAAIGLLAFVAYRRGPREVTPDTAWRSVTGLARRLGFGPRPTQTVYEYSAALGDVLPAVRPELRTVARAKVEVAYGGRVLSADRLRAVRSATGRLRIGLLRLALRRGWRGPRGPRQI